MCNKGKKLQKVYILVALYPIWISGNFWNISAFYGIFGKEAVYRNLPKLLPKSEISYGGIIVLFDFFQDFPEISVDWLFFRKTNNISRNFPRTVPYHLFPFQNFQNFWLNRVRRFFSGVLHFIVTGQCTIDL